MVDRTAMESLKTKELPPTWPKGLLTFFIVIFLVVLGAYFGLNFWNQNQVSKLDILEDEFQNIRSSFSIDEEQKVVLFERKLNALNNLLNNHIYFSNILSLFEELTHPQVYYSRLDFSLNKNFISLNGVAKDQGILSEAINGLINNPEKVKAVVLKEMQIDLKNLVNFSYDIYFNPNVLKHQLNEGN
ncbi:MAG: hypothetical protein PHG13_01710 [Candidatus Pacebacteria bacterium]|nr:hypothetical protein [Candidatus Paceibacterota bacterium]MDD5721848.1 hypothetical protein [Candidatus Paceibacterota bacterium]